MSGADHDVVVIGAGPTGLLAASELARRGVDVAIFERRPGDDAGSRAIGVHAPVLAALEESGATDRILADAVRIPRGIARTRERRLGEVRFDRLSSRFPFVATVPQAATEAAVAVGAPAARRATRVTSVAERGNRVAVRACGPGVEVEITARAVVIAAGAGGRRLAPAGTRATPHGYRDRYLMADVAGGREASVGAAVIALDRAGVLESFPLPRGGRRFVAWDGDGPLRDAETRGDADDADRLRRAVAERTGDEQSAVGIGRASAFGIRRAVAPQMRAGRIFVIGDAAHEVSPIGGQGMNLGLLDAATLAPLLAARLRDADASDALDGWERARLTSARTAARLAGLNTTLGRPRSALAHRIVTFALGAALAGPLEPVAARAYTMGFDRHAVLSRRSHP